MNGKLFYYAGAILAVSLLITHSRKPVSAPAISSAVTVKTVLPESADIIPVPADTELGPTNQNASAITETLPTGTQPAGEVQMNCIGATDTQLEARLELMSYWRDWAAKDLDSALARILNIPVGDERDQALQALCFGLAQTNPDHAVEMAQTLQQPENVMENLVQQWAASDLASALVWVNNLPAGDQRDQLMQRVTFVLSQTDPANSAGLVLEQMPASPAQDEAVMTVVHQWGNQNLQAAASWVLTFPDGALKERATEELKGIARYKDELAQR
jgi:hypothetical protein